MTCPGGRHCPTSWDPTGSRWWPWHWTTMRPTSSRSSRASRSPCCSTGIICCPSLDAISNVPTVVWIDEEGRIARPNGVAFGTDVFIDFTGVAAEHHMDEIRSWVTDGTVPVDADQARAAVEDLSDDELRARLLFRLAAHARRTDRPDDAVRLFAQASELAPLDFTIQRAAMPLRGVDPFGEEFFSLSTVHGRKRDRRTTACRRRPEGKMRDELIDLDATGLAEVIALVTCRRARRSRQRSNASIRSTTSSTP